MSCDKECRRRCQPLRTGSLPQGRLRLPCMPLWCSSMSSCHPNHCQLMLSCLCLSQQPFCQAFALHHTSRLPCQTNRHSFRPKAVPMQGSAICCCSSSVSRSLHIPERRVRRMPSKCSRHLSRRLPGKARCSKHARPVSQYCLSMSSRRPLPHCFSVLPRVCRPLCRHGKRVPRQARSGVPFSMKWWGSSISESPHRCHRMWTTAR